MRILHALLPLALVTAAGPVHAEDVVTHGWGYTSLEDGIYTSRGFCDATWNSTLVVSTTITCRLVNTVDPNNTGVTVVGSTPTTAAATVEARTDGRGRLCLSTVAQMIDGTYRYYPGPAPTDMECTLL